MTDTLVAKQDGQATRAAMFRELGISGLQQTGGQVREEWLPELRGPRGMRTLRRMSDDAVVGAGLTTLRMLMREPDWHAEPVDDTPQAAEAAEWVDGALNDMNQSWSSTLDEILSMLEFGHAPMEIVLKRRQGRQSDPTSRFDDGRVGVRKLALRGQDTVRRWLFDDAGGIQGLVQQTSHGQIPIPIGKLLLFRTQRRGNNPEGRSILRSAYEPWYYARNIRRVEAIGIERDLTGLPVFGVPAELFNNPSKKAQLDTWKKVAANIKADEMAGIVMPVEYARDHDGRPMNAAPMYTLQLASAEGDRNIDTDAVVARYVREIVLAMFTDVRLLGMEKIGTQALAQEKTALLNSFLNSLLDEVADVVTRHLLPLLWSVNGFNPDVMPMWDHDTVRFYDVGELGDALQKLVQAGMIIPDDESERWLRTELGAPQTVDTRQQQRDDELDGEV